MKILVVANFYPPRAIGGAEIVAHRHALELTTRGHQVQAFTGRTPTPDLKSGELEIECVDGLIVHSLAIRSYEIDRAFHWDAAGRRFRSVLHYFKPDVVHFHNLTGLGVNLISEARRYGARTICTMHDHWGFCARNTLLLDGPAICADFEACHFCYPRLRAESGEERPYRLRRDYVFDALSQADLLVFPSHYLAEAYRRAGFPAEKLRVQSNGVEIHRFEKARPETGNGPLRAIAIGYLGEHKGFDVLLNAVDLLLQRPELNGRWKISIVGDGHLRERIVAFAGDPRRRDHVEFIGKLPAASIPSLVCGSDVIIMPSIWPENEPVVILEAIVAGTAQIVTRIGGHLELVDEGRSGLFCQPGSADDLAAKLSVYIDDREMARRHGDYNWARRDAFAQSASVDAYEAMFASLQRPARDANEIIVLCEGDPPSRETFKLMDSFSMFENETKFRFIHVDWADPELWTRAHALFHWSREARDVIVSRAARLGAAIFGPVGNAMVEALEREGARALVYKDASEVICALLALGAQARAVGGKAFDARRFADCAAAAIDSSAFELHAEDPAI